MTIITELDRAIRERVADQVGESGLRLVAQATWPVDEHDQPPPSIAGFVASTFSPLVAEVAKRCLQAAGRSPWSEPVEAQAADPVVAVVIVSAAGDEQTAQAVAQAVDEGRRVAPLLFFQSVPNAVAGLVAARWGLTGPVVCLSPTTEQVSEQLGAALSAADLLITDGDAQAALLVVVNQANGVETGDRAIAVLVQDNRADAAPSTSTRRVPRHREGEGS